MKRITLVLLMGVFLAALTFAQTMNPDKPLKGTWDFQMKKMWETEGAGGDLFGGLQNIRAAKDGRIYLLDSKHFKIYIFNKEGKFLSSFGSKGEGPGEIRMTGRGNQLHVIENSIIYVDRGRIHYFSLDGKFEKSVIIPSQLRPSAFVSEDVLVSAPATVVAGTRTAKIKLYNVTDKTENIISEFQPFEKAVDTKESGGRRVSLGIVIEDITPMVFVNSSGGKIYYGKSDVYKINVVDPKGKETAVFGIAGRVRNTISAQYKKNLMESFSDLPTDMVKKIINGLPELASFFQDIVIGENGLIYVVVSDPDKNTLRAVDIFSPDGKYLYRSEFKVEAGLSIGILYLKDDLLVVAADDEDGNQKVVNYSIIPPAL